MTAREAAFISLTKYRGSGKYSNIELSGSIERFNLQGKEKSFYTALFYGVIEREITLNYYISKISSRKTDEIDSNVLTIIQLGLYQLIYMDKVPESAAVNESVNLARRFYAKKNSENFINAVLRNYIREKDKIKLPKFVDDSLEFISIKYSLPKWIAKLWIDAYGEKIAEKIAIETLSHPQMTLRVNTLKISVEDLKVKLEEKGIKSEIIYPTALCLINSTAISELSEFDGLYFVQDKASQMAVDVLGAKEGEIVLDSCACPGGKSFGISINMNNKGKVYSRDLHKNKLSLIEKTAEKLGISIIETAEQNGTKFDENMPLVDKIICDVPCSGLGVISKKPDIKYKDKEDIERLPELQYQILENNIKYLRKGGEIIYSTCTLNPKENKEVVMKFLENHKDFELVPFEVDKYKSNGILEIIPEKNIDGFFISKMKRV